MNRVLIIFVLFCVIFVQGEECCDSKEEVSAWQGSWRMYPTVASWSVHTRIPTSSEFGEARKKGSTRGKLKAKRKFKRFLLPLLLAYKLKFFTLIPVLIGGLILLKGATALAGFFFALFAAVMGLKSGGEYEEARKKGSTRVKHKVKKKLKRKLKRFILPLLLTYKLKFFTLIPVLIGGLILLTGATGLAGFFFALFAAVMGVKRGH